MTKTKVGSGKPVPTEAGDGEHPIAWRGRRWVPTVITAIVIAVALGSGLLIDRALGSSTPTALSGCQTRHLGVAENASVKEIHDVEGGAKNFRVLAQGPHAGYRKANVTKRLHHPVFTIHLVGAGQKLARRLFAHHIAVVAGG